MYFAELCVLSWVWLFWDPMDCSLPGSSVHGIFLAKNTELGCHFLLQWIIPTQDQTHIFCVGRRIFYHWATWEVCTNLYSVQFSSVAQSCPTLCDPMNRSTPGLPVRHQLPEFTQTHVHWVNDAIQPSHPLSSPSPPAPLIAWFVSAQLFEYRLLRSLFVATSRGPAPTDSGYSKERWPRRLFIC